MTRDNRAAQRERSQAQNFSNQIVVDKVNDMLPPKRAVTLRNASDLIEHGLVRPEARAAIAEVAAQFSVTITPSVFDTIANADPDGGVARQYVPSAAELTVTEDERADPIGDARHSPVKGIIHRYPDRALLNVLSNCAVYCRFCFRRETIGQSLKALNQDELEGAIAYIRENPAIWEVILSGGDPLMLPAKQLSSIAGRIAAIEHVGILRVHTRVPVAAPERITDELIAALRVKAPTWVAVHVNHPDELTDAVRAACGRLVDAGIPLVSQSVLLKGINNDAATLTRLFRGLVQMRIKPYYLHHGDKAKGTSHFRTTLDEGQAIMTEMRGAVSGLCQPTYVLDIPGGHGKVPVGPGYVARGADGACVVRDTRGCEWRYE